MAEAREWKVDAAAPDREQRVAAQRVAQEDRVVERGRRYRKRPGARNDPVLGPLDPLAPGEVRVRVAPHPGPLEQQQADERSERAAREPEPQQLRPGGREQPSRPGDEPRLVRQPCERAQLVPHPSGEQIRGRDGEGQRGEERPARTRREERGAEEGERKRERTEREHGQQRRRRARACASPLAGERTGLTAPDPPCARRGRGGCGHCARATRRRAARGSARPAARRSTRPPGSGARAPPGSGRAASSP